MPIVEPLRKAYPPLKYQAWHRMIHPYYTKQPSNVVGEYIKHFSKEGDLVVDPFVGSGVTAIESLTNRRRTICGDLDPLAVFITRQTCLAPIDLNAYGEAYVEITNKMRPIVDFVRGASSQELDRYELKEWYPKGVKLPSNADRDYVEELFTKAQLVILAHLRSNILNIENKEARDLLLFAFSSSLDKASIMYRYSTTDTGTRGDSGIFIVHRYWVPPEPTYRDAWSVFENRVKLLTKAKNASNRLFGDFVREGENFNVYCDSATNLLKHMDKNSVDYIYTDPPYGAHISYLDLSTMWHAWLGLEVTNDTRQKEAIEGGEQQFDETHYLHMLQLSFEQMFHALKDDAWLSLVFHHKETKLWYSIRDMLRYIGFSYVNTVAQSLAYKSFHKVKNPLRTLGESLIVNFQKTPTRKMSQPMSLPMANIIKNVAERVIYRNGGATTEEILREVVPELFENDLFIDAASKSMGDIVGILEGDFHLGEDNIWQIKHEQHVGNFIPAKLRIQYYVIGFLRKNSKASFDNIVTTILPLLINGHETTPNDIAGVLNEIAVSHDRVNWELKDPKTLETQGVLSFPLFTRGEEYTTEIPESTLHNQQIYRLAILCEKVGLTPFIGKKERGDPMFARLKLSNVLDIEASPIEMKRIEQIDIIWTTSDAKPVWVFEVEESTTILSALERFVALLSSVPELGKSRRLTIVAPKTRRRKVQQELTGSSYIGHPQYLENKITYMYYDDLESGFIRYSSHKELRLEDIHLLCKLPIF